MSHRKAYFTEHIHPHSRSQNRYATEFGSLEKYFRKNFLADLANPARLYRRYLYHRHGLQAGPLFSLRMLHENASLKYYQPLSSLPQYHPLLPEVHKSRRLCEDRWKLLSPYLQTARSCIDVGCESGFFTFKMARRVKFCLGLERDPKAYALACALAELNSPKPAFMNCALDLATVRALPTVDVISCFSVFHWLVLDFGFDEAQEIFRNLSRRCRMQLLFETGQSDEDVEQFDGVLDFMGEDPRSWITRFLHSLGFEEVICLGRAATSVSAVPRYLFVANRSRYQRDLEQIDDEEAKLAIGVQVGD